MAGSAVVGALRVNLGIDSADFNKGLANAQTRLASVAANVAKAGAAIAVGLGIALGGAVKKTLDNMDELSKAAQSFGIPIEQLSALKYAADLSGVGLDALGVSMGKLSKNMVDVAAGAGGAAKAAFEKLGISVKNSDGTLKSSTSVLEELSGKFAEMPDGAEKTALAMQLMGKSGAAMIPLLNGGTTALQAQIAEAKKFGLVITQEAAAGAEQFNDNLTRLSAMVGGVMIQATSGLTKTLSTLSNTFVAIVGNTDTMNFAIDAITMTLKGLVTGGIITGEVFKQLGRAVAAVGTAVGLVAKGDFSFAFDTLRDFAAEADADFTASANLIKKVWEDSVDSVTSVTVNKLRPNLNGLGNAGAAAGKAIAGGVQAASAAMDRVADQAKQVGDVIGNSFSSAFDQAIDGTLNFQDAISGLLKDLGKLLLNQAFNSLIGGIFGGGGGIFGGGGVATGAPMNLLGFAAGGLAKVTGTGGIDSQLVQFRATPGETVQIHKPGQDGGAPGGLAISVDARGAGPGVGAEVRQAILSAVAESERRTQRSIVPTVKAAQSRRAL